MDIFEKINFKVCYVQKKRAPTFTNDSCLMQRPVSTSTCILKQTALNPRTLCPDGWSPDI